MKTKDKSPAEPELESLRAGYTQLCESHRAVADFRAKLLALLPIATGAGLFLLLKEETKAFAIPHFVAIGLFGFLATVGLFLHEIHGIGECWELIQRGARLETFLGLGNGQFGTIIAFKKNHPLFKFIFGPEGAASLIYPTTMSAWLYLTALPPKPLIEKEHVGIAWAILVVLGLFSLVLCLYLHTLEVDTIDS